MAMSKLLSLSAWLSVVRATHAAGIFLSEPMTSTHHGHHIASARFNRCWAVKRGDKNTAMVFTS